MIRTLVCATSDLARAGLVAVVRGDARLELAGQTTPEALVARVRALDPDVVLEAREPTTAMLGTPSVALVDDPVGAWALARESREYAGAHAILARDASPEEIVGALLAVASGLVAVQPAVLARAEVARGDNPAPGGDEVRPEPIATTGERLTAREIDVLGELARGVPNKIIATRLKISEHTVKFHVASIFAKLSVASRTEAVTRGVRLGLIML